MANENIALAGAMPAIGIGLDIANAVGGWIGGNKRQERRRKSESNLYGL